MTDRLLTAAELAEILHVTPRWVRSHTGPPRPSSPNSLNIPHFNLGKYPRYELDAVQAWLKEQERGGGRGRRRSAA